MKIFLDTADLDEIRKWLSYGVLDGVTTNPSIMLKCKGYDLERRAREIAELVYPRPVSVEVYTNDPQEMLRQARTFARWAENIVVKIPSLNEYGEPCFGVVKALEEEGIRVNMTTVLSFGQMAMGAKAGATYISIFAGRVADEGGDAPALIRASVEWLRRWGYRSQIIVGSIRRAQDITESAIAGAHIVTTPPDLLARWVHHHYTRATVAQFNRDAQEALAKMEALRQAMESAH